jgi:hypothetical protein
MYVCVVWETDVREEQAAPEQQHLKNKLNVSKQRANMDKPNANKQDKSGKNENRQIGYMQSRERNHKRSKNHKGQQETKIQSSHQSDQRKHLRQNRDTVCIQSKSRENNIWRHVQSLWVDRSNPSEVIRAAKKKY